MLNYKKPTIFGFILAAIIIFILYNFLGLDWIYSNYLLILLTIIIVELLTISGIITLGKKISYNIEPEDDKNLLNLRMNQACTKGISLIGFSLAFIIPGIISFQSTPNGGFFLICGISLLLVAEVILITEYAPRYTKLEIIYTLEKEGIKKD